MIFIITVLASKHGLGNKADLCALTEALLCYGCEDTVWEEVTEWHTAVSENKNFAKSTFLPNFDRLYIRQADRFFRFWSSILRKP